MATMFNLTITTNKSEFPYTGRYPSAITLAELKKKLELVVGIYEEDMKLELRDMKGKFRAELANNAKTLEEMGVEGFVIHVSDMSERNCIGNASTDEGTLYTLPDEKYNSREDSARKWKQQVLANSPVEAKIPDIIQVGRRCVVQVGNGPLRPATIQFIGNTEFKLGNWVGVRYDEPVGKNDGSVEGKRYFSCEPDHGGFVHPKAIVSVKEDEQK